MAGNLIYRNSK